MKIFSSRIILLTLGAVATAAIPLWIWVVAPRILALPVDFSFTADIISVDDFYDEARDAYVGGVYSKTTYTYETVSSNNGVSIIRNQFDVRTQDDEPIFSVSRDYGIDRVSGAHMPGFGDRARTGYLFAPRGVNPEDTFTYWHVNYDGPALMRYAGEERLYGLRTLRFQTRYDEVRIDQTANLGHLPGVGTTRGVELDPHLTLWIEPLTGRLVKYQDDTVAYYYDLATGERLHPWNHFTNTFNERSVELIAKAVASERTKAQILAWYVPALLALLALIAFGRARSGGISVFERAAIARVPQAAIAFLILIPLLVLAGWTFAIPVLAQPVPNTIPMNPVTAIAFLLLTTGFLLRNRAGYASVVLGGLVALIGLIRIFETFGLSFFSVDLLLFGDAVLSAEVPVRMAQYTALCFTLLGLVPLVARVESLKRLRLPEIHTSLVFLLSLLLLAEYLLGSIAQLPLPAFFAAAAVHTGFVFLCASGLFYAAYRERDAYALEFKGWLALTWLLLFSIMITIVTAAVFDAFLTQEARNVFDTEVDRASRAIEARIKVYESLLEGAEGLLAASDVVERDEWKAYVDALNIRENYPGIQGIGYAIFVTPEERTAHEKAIRNEGFPNYTIRPPGERDIYSTIIYIEPLDTRNQQAFGFDMFQEPVRRAGMEQARDTGEPRISGRVTLVQEIDADVQPGFLMYVPFYANGKPHETLSERRAHIVGYTYSPFRAHDFVRGIIGEQGLGKIGLRIADGTNGSPESVLYDDWDERGILANSIRFTQTRTIYVSGRPWKLSFAAPAGFGDVAYAKFTVPVVIGAGIVVSILLALMFYTLASTRARALAYADRATKDLAEAKRVVDERLAESERVNRIMVDRELRMVELKKELQRQSISPSGGASV